MLYPLRRARPRRTTDQTAGFRPGEDVSGPMTTGTMHMGGFAAGAARPGACPLAAAYRGTSAPLAATITWHDGSKVKQDSPVFGTDRPTPRPVERFP